jgi:hypothetical protein
VTEKNRQLTLVQNENTTSGARYIASVNGIDGHMAVFKEVTPNPMESRSR